MDGIKNYDYYRLRRNRDERVEGNDVKEGR